MPEGVAQYVEVLATGLMVGFFACAVFGFLRWGIQRLIALFKKIVH